MQAVAHDLPTVEEELDRKAIETLEQLLLRRQQGKITEAQFDVGLDALFSVAAGLVRDDFAELISLAGNEIDRNDSSFIQRRVFVKGGSILYINSNLDSETVIVKRCVAEGWTTVVKRFDDKPIAAVAIKQYVDFVAKGMIGKGYEEI